MLRVQFRVQIVLRVKFRVQAQCLSNSSAFLLEDVLKHADAFEDMHLDSLEHTIDCSKKLAEHF